MKKYFCLMLLTGLLLSSGGAFATPDPTQPPAAWLITAESTQSGAAGREGLRLQSVLLPQQGKPVAIIGGTTVTLGGRLGEARLVKLTEREAVLQGPDGVIHLYLTPDVKKQMVVMPSSRRAGQAGQARDLR